MANFDGVPDVRDNIVGICNPVRIAYLQLDAVAELAVARCGAGKGRAVQYCMMLRIPVGHASGVAQIGKP